VTWQKTDAQEIYRIIRLITEDALGHILNTAFISKNHDVDILKFLEKNGINLKTKSLDEIIELVDSCLQIVCSGRADLDAGKKNIIIESRMNSGHSLPWASIITGYLNKNGYKPRTVFQNPSQKGEKIHIKINS